MAEAPRTSVDQGWVTSSYSSGSGECVQVRVSAEVGVRDSKNISGPALAFAPDAWRTFITSIG